MITMSNSQGQQTASFGGGSQYGAATGRTTNFGYTNPAAGHGDPSPRGAGGGGGGGRTAIPQLGTSEAIGVPDSAPQGQQQGQQSGRLPNFMRGSSEGLPGGGAAAGGEAAGGAVAGGELAELAPLALAL